MISRWEKGIIFLSYNQVLEYLLIGVNPGSTNSVNDRHGVEECNRRAVCGWVKHRRLLVRVCNHESFNNVKNDQRHQADREQNRQSWAEKHRHEYNVEYISILPMNCEGWAAINLFEGLDSLAICAERITCTEWPLVPSSVSISESPITKEFNQRIDCIWDHGTDDHSADIVEPKCIQISVDTSKVALNYWNTWCTTVPWCHSVYKAIIEHTHVEYGDCDPCCFIGNTRKSEKCSNPDQNASDDIGIDDNALREYCRHYRRIRRTAKNFFSKFLACLCLLNLNCAILHCLHPCLFIFEIVFWL